MEKVNAAIDAALASDKAVVLQDSGDAINNGDQTKSDGIYSARLSIDKAFPSGQAFIAFSIELPDGKRTRPVITAFYVMPKPAEAPSSGK